MNRETRRHVIWAPLGIWAGLMALLALTAGYAYWDGMPVKPVVSLGIGVAKGLLIALFFMQLRRSAGLVKLAAMTGLIWASFMFLFTFADFLTR